MGGAAGHMAHPFDCREVRSGKDLINFYVKAVDAIPLYEETDFDIRDNATSLKLDGVNASFRLQQANNPAGFMFVLDRGATSDRSPVGKLDYAGITPDNALARFKNNPDHGMIQVVNHISKILNHNLEKLKPFVQALGVFEQMGPDGVFFDVEYYSNEDSERGIKKIGNVTDYNQSFIAIHGLKDFHTEEKTSKRGKVTTSRKARGFYWETNEEINSLLTRKDELLAQKQDTSSIDQLIVDKNRELNVRRKEHQDILSSFGKALTDHANDLDLPFSVHTKIGLQFKEGLTRELVLKRIDDALKNGIEGFSYKKINENESFGPTIINEATGETMARPLKDLLLDIEKNPAHVSYYPEEFKKTNKKGKSEPELGTIKASDEWTRKHGKSSKQSAFAKQFYDDIIQKGEGTGIGAFNIGADDNSSEAINDAVILWEAVRVIGNVLKESVIADTDLGPSVAEQEGIVIQSEKICDGIAFKFTGDFIVSGGESPHRKEVPQANESNVSYGKLLESFVFEESPLEKSKQYVIMVPGGFKPPTGGHYSMIKQYDEKSDVIKVFVVTGPKAREGVTLEQSKEIFNVYGGFSDKGEFITGDEPQPIHTCYELIKNPKFTSQFSNASFSIGAGDKDNDSKRIKQFVNYFDQRPELTNADVVAYPAARTLEVGGIAASASRMRKAFKENDWETFKKLLPNEALYDNVVKILSKGGSLEEGFFSKDRLYSLVDEVIQEKWSASNQKCKDAEGETGSAVVKKLETGKVESCHGSMSKAKAAVRARYANYKEGKEKRTEEVIKEQELDSETQQELQKKARMLVANFLAFQIPFSLDKLEKEKIVDNVADQLTDELFNSAKNLTDKREKEVKDLVDETSMSGGSVAGGMAGAFTQEYEREQK